MALKKKTAPKKEEPVPPPAVAAPKRSARAVVKYLRISPRKVRLVINTIRFKHPDQAFGILSLLKKKAARITEKILKTAVANAKVLGLDETRLYISDVRADGGPSLKRFMQRSMGRADRILKRTTHLSMVLSEGDRKYRASESSSEAQQVEKEAASKGGKKLFGRKKKASAGAVV